MKQKILRLLQHNDVEIRKQGIDIFIDVNYDISRRERADIFAKILELNPKKTRRRMDKS